MTLQKTIAKSVRCSGIGLHSGRKVELELLPADADSGIVFSIDTDHGTKFLSPSPENVVGTGLATTLGNGDGSVATVEHLLAAVRGMGIDNILIKTNGGEVPIMDGSAASFVYLLRSAGLREQGRKRKVLAVRRPFEHANGAKRIKAEPYDGFRVDYVIEFDHPLIGRQSLGFELSPENFVERVAKARTFGFLDEVELMHRNGLALGGSLDNAVVLDEYGVVNDEGLRFTDEFVRHKVLDFIGDMAVAPLPLMGRFEVACSGHAFNNEFLRLLTRDAAACLEVRELAVPGRRAAAQVAAREALAPAPAAA